MREWFSKLNSWSASSLTGPIEQLATEDRAQRQYLTQTVLTLMVSALLPFTLLVAAGWLAGMFSFGDVEIMLALVVPTGICWLLAKRGHWQWGSYVAPMLMFGLGLFGSASGNLGTIFVIFYGLAILLTGMLVGNWAQWVMVGICTAAHVGVAGAYHPWPLDVQLAIAITLSGGFVGIALLQWFSTRQLQRVLAQAHATTIELRAEMVERQQAEEFRHQSEEKYRLIAENVADIIWIVDLEFNVQYVSPSVMRMRGYTVAEAMQQKLQDIFTPASLELVLQVFAEEMLKEQISPVDLERTRELELEEYCRDGSTIWTENTLTFLRNSVDKPIGIVGVTRNITERRQAEHALRESQTMLQLIFDHAFDGISVYEEFPEQSTRRLLDCNARYAEIAGRSREELLAMGNTLPIQKDIDYQLSRQEFLAELNAGVYLGRFSWLRPDGRDNVVEYAAVARQVDDRLLVIGVDRDITAQVQAIRERDALIKELETKNAELERFTYTVSHDLKAPLITIGGFLGFLEKDMLAGDLERVKADVVRISEATTRMQRLLNELLELSRIGRMMNPPQTVPFGIIVREAVELVRGRIEARGARLEIAPNLPPVYGDRLRLVEVMQNLLDNACKFMGDQPQPRIEIGMGEAKGQPVFFVRDNGLGIDPSYHDRVFGLFNKLDPKTAGTGIGLALVKRIIEVHSGKIWVESEGLGQGATFYFTLPCQTV